ncbi:tyrosine-type recombinase/integrase [Caenibacillus caldisaponilyticus]|uniref:tyrosine-type recombinase/integrase n=1 Tax=Caenibacillus caldisaponilyticus TaxID=1674942 RepID=UPI0009886C95|nr:tyrosine-type recombinase/integrase [Caenibacillus caldisaponilyticus]
MMEHGAKVTSINTRLRAVRAFFNFLENKGKIPQNPMKDVKLLNAKRNPIQTFSQEQIQALLNAVDLKTFTGVRDYTIILFLLETGVRLKELCAIDVNDVELESGQVLVRDPKNQLERYVPIGKKMRDQLRKYLKIRGYLETDALFVTVNNTRISRGQVEKRLAQLGKKAGIKGVRCSPHTFRHTFAKMSILNDAGVYELQAILGHQSMEMVRVYVNLFSPEVKGMHKKFSPVEKLLC